MSKQAPKNEPTAAVSKFCLTLEAARRTPEGRVRTPQEFVQYFFPYDDERATDRIFVHLPKDVRGPLLTAWGLRAQKSALRDGNEKVRDVVHDALVAGDLDAASFEDGLTAETVIRFVPLQDWWSFWRGGKLGKDAITKALDAGYALGLFDAKLFLDSLEGGGGSIKGTNVVGEGLSKAELVDWVCRIYQGGDCSAKGMLAALGWDRALQKTPNESLVQFLDSVAAKVALGQGPKADDSTAASRPRGPGIADADAEGPSLQLTGDVDELLDITVSADADAPVAAAKAASKH